MTLIRISGVAETLGISTKKAHRLTKRPDFPDEVEGEFCRSWRTWEREDVIRWATISEYWDPATESFDDSSGCIHCGRGRKSTG